MAHVFIPPSLRSLTDGREVVEVPGTSVREIINVLEQGFPGLHAQLCQDGALRTGWCVAVGGSVHPLGLLAKVASDSEIHFLPLAGGG